MDDTDLQLRFGSPLMSWGGGSRVSPYLSTVHDPQPLVPCRQSYPVPVTSTARIHSPPPSPTGAPTVPDQREPGGFRAGLLEPSATSLALTAFVAVAWCLGAVAWITPDWVASPQGMRLAVGGQDRDLRVTRLALDLSGRERLEGRSVFLLGASDFREALTSPVALEEKLPSGVEVYDLYSGWQSLLDTAALVEQLPKRFSGVVVVMVSPKRIAHGITYHIDFEDQPPFHRNLGFRSPIREEIARREGVATSFRSKYLVLDNYHFYLPRLRHLIESPFGEPVRLAHHGLTAVTAKPLPPERRELLRRELRKVLDGYEANREDSLWMLERIQQMVEGRGGQLVLLEAPMAPLDLEEVVGPELRARYQLDITTFASSRGLPYWDLAEQADFQDEDFWDPQHLVSKRGRGRFTEALAERLAPLLGGIGGSAGSLWAVGKSPEDER